MAVEKPLHIVSVQGKYEIQNNDLNSGYIINNHDTSTDILSVKVADRFHTATIGDTQNANLESNSFSLTFEMEENEEGQILDERITLVLRTELDIQNSENNDSTVIPVDIHKVKLTSNIGVTSDNFFDNTIILDEPIIFNYRHEDYYSTTDANGMLYETEDDLIAISGCIDPLAVQCDGSEDAVYDTSCFNTCHVFQRPTTYCNYNVELVCGDVNACSCDNPLCYDLCAFCGTEQEYLCTAEGFYNKKINEPNVTSDNNECVYPQQRIQIGFERDTFDTFDTPVNISKNLDESWIFDENDDELGVLIRILKSNADINWNGVEEITNFSFDVDGLLLQGTCDYLDNYSGQRYTCIHEDGYVDEQLTWGTTGSGQASTSYDECTTACQSSDYITANGLQSNLSMCMIRPKTRYCTDPNSQDFMTECLDDEFCSVGSDKTLNIVTKNMLNDVKTSFVGTTIPLDYVEEDGEYDIYKIKRRYILGDIDAEISLPWRVNGLIKLKVCITDVSFSKIEGNDNTILSHGFLSTCSHDNNIYCNINDDCGEGNTCQHNSKQCIDIYPELPTKPDDIDVSTSDIENIDSFLNPYTCVSKSVPDLLIDDSCHQYTNRYSATECLQNNECEIVLNRTRMGKLWMGVYKQRTYMNQNNPMFPSLMLDGPGPYDYHSVANDFMKYMGFNNDIGPQNSNFSPSESIYFDHPPWIWWEASVTGGVGTFMSSNGDVSGNFNSWFPMSSDTGGYEYLMKFSFYKNMIWDLKCDTLMGDSIYNTVGSAVAKISPGYCRHYFFNDLTDGVSYNATYVETYGSLPMFNYKIDNTNYNVDYYWNPYDKWYSETNNMPDSGIPNGMMFSWMWIHYNDSRCECADPNNCLDGETENYCNGYPCEDPFDAYYNHGQRCIFFPAIHPASVSETGYWVSNTPYYHQSYFTYNPFDENVIKTVKSQFDISPQQMAFSTPCKEYFYKGMSTILSFNKFEDGNSIKRIEYETELVTQVDKNDDGQYDTWLGTKINLFAGEPYFTFFNASDPPVYPYHLQMYYDSCGVCSDGDSLHYPNSDIGEGGQCCLEPFELLSWYQEDPTVQTGSGKNYKKRKRICSDTLEPFVDTTDGTNYYHSNVDGCEGVIDCAGVCHINYQLVDPGSSYYAYNFTDFSRIDNYGSCCLAGNIDPCGVCNGKSECELSCPTTSYGATHIDFVPGDSNQPSPGLNEGYFTIRIKNENEIFNFINLEIYGVNTNNAELSSEYGGGNSDPINNFEAFSEIGESSITITSLMNVEGNIWTPENGYLQVMIYYDDILPIMTDNGYQLNVCFNKPLITTPVGDTDVVLPDVIFEPQYFRSFLLEDNSEVYCLETPNLTYYSCDDPNAVNYEVECETYGFCVPAGCQYWDCEEGDYVVDIDVSVFDECNVCGGGNTTENCNSYENGNFYNETLCTQMDCGGFCLNQIEYGREYDTRYDPLIGEEVSQCCYPTQKDCYGICRVGEPDQYGELKPIAHYPDYDEDWLACREQFVNEDFIPIEPEYHCIIYCTADEDPVPECTEGQFLSDLDREDRDIQWLPNPVLYNPGCVDWETQTVPFPHIQWEAGCRNYQEALVTGWYLQNAPIEDGDTTSNLLPPECVGQEGNQICIRGDNAGQACGTHVDCDGESCGEEDYCLWDLDCECKSIDLDECGVCFGDNNSCSGCMDIEAINYGTGIGYCDTDICSGDSLYNAEASCSSDNDCQRFIVTNNNSCFYFEDLYDGEFNSGLLTLESSWEYFIQDNMLNEILLSYYNFYTSNDEVDIYNNLYDFITNVCDTTYCQPTHCDDQYIWNYIENFLIDSVEISDVGCTETFIGNSNCLADTSYTFYGIQNFFNQLYTTDDGDQLINNFFPTIYDACISDSCLTDGAACIEENLGTDCPILDYSLFDADNGIFNTEWAIAWYNLEQPYAAPDVPGTGLEDEFQFLLDFYNSESTEYFGESGFYNLDSWLAWNITDGEHNLPNTIAEICDQTYCEDGNFCDQPYCEEHTLCGVDYCLNPDNLGDVQLYTDEDCVMHICSAAGTPDDFNFLGSFYISPDNDEEHFGPTAADGDIYYNNLDRWLLARGESNLDYIPLTLSEYGGAADIDHSNTIAMGSFVDIGPPKGRYLIYYPFEESISIKSLGDYIYNENPDDNPDAVGVGLVFGDYIEVKTPNGFAYSATYLPGIVPDDWTFISSDLDFSGDFGNDTEQSCGEDDGSCITRGFIAEFWPAEADDRTNLFNNEGVIGWLKFK